MPHLEIHFADGRREEQELTRTAPLTVGTQSFNDVQVSDEGVSPLHCRIGWSKTGFEVTAATPQGVDLNGTIVEHAFLKPGDVIRVGRCDLFYRSDVRDAESRPKAEPLKREQSPAGREDGSKNAPDDEPVSLFEGPVLAQSMDELSASDLASQSMDEVPTLMRSKGSTAAPPPTGTLQKVRRELQGGRRRPGEQEIFKSPLVLILGGGTLVLLLIAGTIWLIMGRETSGRLYEQAERDLADGKYAQAIEQFDEYVRRYPRSSRTMSARISAAKARVQKELAGATPAWSLAWEQLDRLVREFRNSNEYRALRPIVSGFAEEIAIGAAKSAEQTRDPELLPISADARQLLERSVDAETPLGAVLSRIQEATARAEAAIARQGSRDAAVAAMQTALSARQPIDALVEREALLRKFPQYRRDQGVEQVLQQALALERQTVQVTEVDREADAVTPPPPIHHVLPVFHSRSRTDEGSLGQSVWVLAQDSCYAVDTITGNVHWRRVIGFDPPFYPVETGGPGSSWLLFDKVNGRLVHCRQETGASIWEQTLEAAPLGRPLVDEGQVYLVTADQRLLRVDLQTGDVTAAVSFAQPVSGPPTLNVSGEFLFVAGDRGLIYAIRKRPLECVAVTFTDHAAGAVQAPLVTMGRLLLSVENDRASSARLRVWDATQPEQPLRHVAEHRVPGLVFDAPVLRGSHLVVPLQGERLAAFIVNDAAGRMDLTSVGEYRVQDGYSGPLHVVLGPDQQFWMSSTAFRRFQITPDSLRMDPGVVAIGLTAQRLQAIGEMFFVGRRTLFGGAVQFTNIDRDRMTGTWRTVVGARPEGVTVGAGGNAVLVTESGFLFNIGSSRLKSGGVEQEAGTDLEWPAGLDEPPLIGELGDGRITVAIAGSRPRLWLVESTGRTQQLGLGQPLQRPPVLLSAGLVLPLPGRLSVRPLSGTVQFEDWRAPVEVDSATRWAHVVRTADDELLAIDTDGRYRRLQVRMGEIPHLAEIASVELTPPSSIAPITINESVVVADVQNVLRRLDQRALDPVAERRWERSIGGLAPVEGGLLLWDSEKLCLVNPDADFSEHWSALLSGYAPVGQPATRGEMLWMACRDGTVLAVDSRTGQLRVKQRVSQSVTYGLLAIGPDLWAVACDGTLYRIDVAMETQP